MLRWDGHICIQEENQGEKVEGDCVKQSLMYEGVIGVGMA